MVGLCVSPYAARNIARREAVHMHSHTRALYLMLLSLSPFYVSLAPQLCILSCARTTVVVALAYMCVCVCVCVCLLYGESSPIVFAFFHGMHISPMLLFPPSCGCSRLCVLLLLWSAVDKLSCGLNYGSYIENNIFILLLAQWGGISWRMIYRTLSFAQIFTSRHLL